MQRPGGEAAQAKTRVTARGRVDSETGKKAIGEMLDGGLATLKSSMQIPKAKAKAKPKAKAASQKKGQGEADKANKELQKDIKAFLSRNIINHRPLHLTEAA